MEFVPDIEWEFKVGHPARIIVGVDEVGRGCLAGPVTAAAVVLPAEVSFTKEAWLKDVTDSKLLTADARERLAPLIRQWVRFSAVASATVEEIDRINILWASQLAMCRAIEQLGLPDGQSPDHVLIDGSLPLKGVRCTSTPIVKGDRKCLSIACASILAKVWRDRHMVELDLRYPGYGLATHKGYPTPAHTEALDRLGVADIHRRSFSPVSSRLKPQ